MGTRGFVLFLALVFSSASAGAEQKEQKGEANFVSKRGSPCENIGKRALEKNGSEGIRKKKIKFLATITVDVYKASLYLDKASHDSSQILKSSGLKELELVMLPLPFGKKLGPKDMKEGLALGWENNATAEDKKRFQTEYAKLEEVIDKMPALKAGDKFVFCFLPNRVEIYAQTGDGGFKALTPKDGIVGEEFSKFLPSFWIGNPPDPELNTDMKNALLGISASKQQYMDEKKSGASH